MNSINNVPNQYIPPNNDEIDLFELCITLWKNKWTIICITSLFTVLALVIAFFVMRPVYQSQIKITPPFLYQIDVLNKDTVSTDIASSDITEGHLSPLSTEDLYSLLKNRLESYELQYQFFVDSYIPSQQEKITATSDNFQKFQKDVLSISSDQKNSDIYTLSIKSLDSENAQNLITQFLELANQSAKDILIKNKKAALQLSINSKKIAIRELKDNLISEHRNKIIALESSLSIAKKLDIIKPLNLSNPELSITEPYMEGVEVLSDKIKQLKLEKDNFSLNQKYNELQSELSALNRVIFPKFDSFNTYNIDQEATLPEKPIKPNKKLIVIIGFLLGGIFAVLFVLIRQAIRTRLSQSNSLETK